jgi:hypothetical protein
LQSDKGSELASYRNGSALQVRFCKQVNEKSIWRLRVQVIAPGNPGKYPRFSEVVSHYVIRKSGVPMEKADPFTPLIIAIYSFVLKKMRIFALPRC